MTSLDTTKLYFELSNSGNLNIIEELFSSDAIYNSDVTGLYFRKSNIMTMMRGFFDKFDSLHWDIESIYEAKNGIVEVHFRAVFKNQEITTQRHGIERLIIQDGQIKYIEVKNNS